jgi:sensor histidine kinase YesM
VPIEPDFLLATLASLRRLIDTDTPRAHRMLAQLDDYLRASLLAARKAETTLGDEFALLERYLELLSARMGERLTWSLALPKPLDSQPLPPTLLQPLVENAIKHGLEPKLEGGRIDIIAQQSGDRLTLEVRDTGIGLGASAGASGALGIEQVRARLAASYGKRAALKLGNQVPSGAVATIELPFRKG